MRRPLRIALSAVVLGTALAAAVACDDDEDGAPSGTPGATDQYAEEVQLTDSDNGASVKLRNGGELVISLESNPSTGFAWVIAEPAPAALESQGDPEYVPPAGATPAVGAAGTEIFTFKATAEGSAELALEYRRGFEPDVPAEKTFSVTVEIK